MADDSNSDDELIRRAQQGDLHAIVDLVESFRTQLLDMMHVKRFVVARGTYDTQDAYQSVVADFIQRYEQGKFEFRSGEQLFKLFTQLMLHKMIDRFRQDMSLQRGGGRIVGDVHSMHSVASGVDTPSAIVSARELFDEVMSHLSPDDRQIAILHFNGLTWQEIGDRLHLRDDATRKRLSRALQRVARTLGLSNIAEGEDANSID